MPFFEDLVVTEEGAPVSVSTVGDTEYYVIDERLPSPCGGTTD